MSALTLRIGIGLPAAGVELRFDGYYRPEWPSNQSAP